MCPSFTTPPITVLRLHLCVTAVTHASIELWEYMDVIRRSADRRCSRHLENLAVMIDSMLSHPGTRKAVKALFGLSGLEHDYDFVSTIEVSVQVRRRHGSTGCSSDHQMALESWQAKNWDPDVGSDEFDEFCKRINHPYNSFQDAVETTGVDADDVMVLISAPGFDFTLLNYAAYVRAVRQLEVRWFPALTLNRKSFPRVRRAKQSKRWILCPIPSYLVFDGRASSASGHSMMPNTRELLWTRNGGSGRSKFAHSGAISSYVHVPLSPEHRLTIHRLRHQIRRPPGSSLACTLLRMSPRSVIKHSLPESTLQSHHYQTLLLSTHWGTSRLQRKDSLSSMEKVSLRTLT